MPGRHCPGISVFKMFLTHQQLVLLTKKKNKQAQAEALNQMKIEHILRPDGSAVVLEEHVKEVLGLRDDAQKNKMHEPNWKAL